MALDTQVDASMQDYFDVVENVFIGIDDPLFAPADPSDVWPSREDSLGSATEDPKAQQLPLRLRRPTIPPTIWERLRPTIEDLYVNQQLELKEVIAKMKDQYDFDATDKMYKKRLHDWGLRKYYSQEQKMDAIQGLTDERCDWAGNPSLNVNGKPLKEHRLWRPVQQKGTRVSLAARPARITRRNMRQTFAFLNQTQTPQRLQLQQCPESQKVELILKYAQRYYSSYGDQTRSKTHYLFTRDLADAFDQLLMGNKLLETDAIRAFALFNRWCSKFSVLLEQQPFQLMQHLIIYLDSPSRISINHCTIRRSLLQFMASTASSVLRATHPITNLLSLLMEVEQEQFHPLSCRYAELLTHNMRNVTDYETSLFVELGVANMLIGIGQLDMASTLYQRLWGAVQPISSPPTRQQAVVRRGMVGLSITRRDYSTVEDILMQRISWSVEATGEPSGTEEGVLACYDLAWLHEKMGLFPESEKFHRMALEGGLQRDIISLLGRLEILFQFEGFLARQGKDEELAQIKDQYGYLWTELDEWKLPPTLEAEMDAGNGVYRQPTELVACAAEM